MAEGKKSFILYSDQRGLFNKLTDEQAGRLIKHIFSYVNDEDPESDFITELAFESIKTQLKRDLKKWDSYIEKQKANGKKGGRPKTQKTQAFLEKPKKADNVNVNDNVNDNVNVKKNIEDRKADFKKSLLPFLSDYSKLMIKEFAEYWTEHGVNDKKMRFEKEKSFGISRRLSTWKKRSNSFDSKEKPVVYKPEIPKH